MNRFEWVNATSVAEAISLLDGKAVVKAGGIDLLDRMKEGLEAPPRLVNIRNVKGLDRISFDAKDGLRLGPLATLSRIDENPDVRRAYRAIADAAGHTATPQIRNMATIGGNLVQRPRCWYFRNEEFHCRKKGGETCYAQEGENQYHAIMGNEICAIIFPSTPATALLAFDARLEVTGPKGKREIALDEFFVAPEQDVRRENALAANELITEVRVPAPAAGTRSAYTKQGEKESFDWPIADVAVVLELEGQRCRRASVVLGAAAPVPMRAKGAEAALAGKTIDEAVAREAARASVAGATPLSENGYKIPVFEAVVRRTILAAARGGAA
jgi:xanthine dehydrogenase YagS FAD-binding subunit